MCVNAAMEAHVSESSGNIDYEFMRVCAYFGDADEKIEIPPPSILKPIELWTGKQVINVLLRPNRASKVFVNATVKEKFYSGSG